MELKTFMLADHAEAVNGKLYVTGGCWDTLFTGTIPAVQPHLSIVVSLTVPWQSTNERHAVQLELVDADGHPGMPQPMNTEFETGRPAGMRPGDSNNVLMVFNVNGLNLNSEGTYEWVLFIDGEEMGRQALKVIRLDRPAATGSIPAA